MCCSMLSAVKVVMGEARVATTCFHELLAEVREVLEDPVGGQRQDHETGDLGLTSSRRMREGKWVQEEGLQELAVDMSEGVVGAHKSAGSGERLGERMAAAQKTLREEGSGAVDE